MMPSVVRENEPTKQRLVCAFAAVECKQTNGIDMIIAVSNVNNSKPPNGHLLEKERTNENRYSDYYFTIITDLYLGWKRNESNH